MKSTPLLLSLCLVFLSLPQESAAESKNCIDWKKEFSETEVKAFPRGKKILVKSLSNQTNQHEDEWMTYGIRDLLIDLLRAGANVQIFGGATAGYAEASHPDYIVDGSFQHKEERLRIFVAIKEGKGKLLKQYSLNLPYPEHRQFFVDLAEMSVDIFQLIGTEYNSTVTNTVRDATRSTRCYQHYAEGRSAFARYDPKLFATAEKGFEKAKQEDFKSPLGYQGLIDLELFRGLLLKQERKTFVHHYQRAEELLLKMTTLVKPPRSLAPIEKKPKPVQKSSPSPKFDNRFLQSHAFYLEALASTQKGKTSEAITAFEKSLEFAPEDAEGWFQLFRLYQSEGKEAQAQKTWQKAITINPCLKP